jgi:hypothetical protein
MASLEITRFVETSLAQGLSKAEIAQALKTGGWSEREIQSALQTFSDAKFPVPVPKKKSLQLAPGGIFLSNPIHFSLYLDMGFGFPPFSIY